MQNAERNFSLNIDKAREHPHYQKYFELIQGIANEFIPERENKEILANLSTRFLVRHKFSLSEEESKLSLLLILAAANHLLDKDTELEDKKKLLHFIKYLLINEDSYKVDTKIINEKTQRLLSLAKENLNPELSYQLTIDARAWSTESLLSKVRERIGVPKEYENSFSIKVLNLTTDELIQIESTLAYSYFDENEYIIVLPEDFEVATLEHEYIHTQIHGLVRGFNNFLFKGLAETLTDMFTSGEESYIWQRYFVNRMIKNNEYVWKSTLKAWITNNEEDQIEFYKAIINQFGLVSLLSLARMSDDSYLEGIEAKLFLDPIYVVEHFKKKL